MRSLRPLALTLALGCTPGPELEVVGARELGPLVTVDEVELRERGYSLYAFGRSVWLFGDTRLASPDSQGSSLRSNGWSHTLDLVGSDGVDSFVTPTDPSGGPAELFAWTAEELAFNQDNPDARVVIWPLTGVRDDRNDRVLLFYEKLRVSASGARARIGSSLAVWTELEFGPVRPILDAGSEEPTLLFDDPEPPFGQAALIVREQLYAYGCSDALYHPCMLARVELDAVFERDAWEFWTGHGWSFDLADAAALVEADTVLSVSYNVHLSRYLAWFAGQERDEILLRSAERPEGPWSAPIRAFAAEAGIADVLAHPEYRRGAGQFEYLSYRVGAELRLLEIELAPGG
ncbi:MAG: DUF4185 domain-containing protein [Enhygromyxa sp.]